MKTRKLPRFLPRLGCLLLTAVAVLPMSCSKNDGRQPVFAVTGKLVDGTKPAAKAVVLLHPTGPQAPGALRPAARVLADGTFKVSTYLSGDGAPTGTYDLAVVWPNVPKNAPADWDEGPDLLVGRCANPKHSPWHVRVDDKPTDLGVLDLATWKSNPTTRKASSGKNPSPAE